MRLRSMLTITAGTAVALTAVAGCASASSRGSSPDPTAPEPRAASCGRVPGSTGPAARLADLRVTAPASAAAGATIAVQVVVDVHADGPRIITVPAASRLLITRGATVVGASEPGSGPAEVPLPLTAGTTRPAQAAPAALTLVGCAGADGSTQKPLPPGTYGVVAVVAYGQDPLQGAASGGAKQFALVSAPWAISVR